MNRHIGLIIICFIAYANDLFGQGSAVGVVKNFGQTIQQWAITDDISCRERIEDICGGNVKVRVSDMICMDMMKGSGIPTEKYTLDTYLNCFQNIIPGITIEYSEFSEIDEKTQSNFSGSRRVVSCRVKISGKREYDVKDIFYVRQGKITGIDKYMEMKDKKGRTKVKTSVNEFGDFFFSPFDEDEFSLGATYNYSKCFPYGGSINMGGSWWMIGIDFGVADDKHDKSLTLLDMTDIANYTVTYKTKSPDYFISVTPYFKRKYYAIGCGVGWLSSKVYETGSSSSFDYSSSGNSYTIGYSSSDFNQDGDNDDNIIIRPQFKLFVPLNDSWIRDDVWTIIAGVGYDFVLGYKDMNGLNFSIGLQYCFW